MSARLSPDGMYYWDGQAWRSTLSPDGRFRWDGSRWTPVSTMVVPAYGFARARREPTSWTRPLQLAVAGWYVWSILFTLAEPFWMGGMMNNVLSQSLLQQQQVNPNYSPPPAGFTDMMSNVMTFSVWAAVIFYSLIFAVIIVGDWQRWVWMYWVVLVLLGLTALLVPVQLLDWFLVPTTTAARIGMPPWVHPLSVFTGLLATGLFVWMLVALVKRGPWAMRRPAWG